VRLDRTRQAQKGACGQVSCGAFRTSGILQPIACVEPFDTASEEGGDWPAGGSTGALAGAVSE
jgi:hypothetical protein